MGYNMRMVMKRLRRIAIGILPWIIGCAAIGGAIVFVAYKQHRAAEEYEAAREKRCASTFPALWEAKQQEACKYERDNPGNYLPWGYVLLAWPEGITAWAIILTFLVIGWQTAQTRRAAEATEDAAKAALLNAQAVINAERARLLFEVEKERDQKMPGIAIFTIYAVNHGRTPAELARIKGPVETVCGDIYDLPIPLRTNIAKLPDKWHVMPNEKCFIARFIPASMNAEAIEYVRTDGVSINEQNRMIYGEVLYKDGISKDVRYSRYCFRFNREPFSNIGGSIEPAGPSKFNEKT